MAGFVAVGNGASSGGELRIYEDTDLGTNYSGFTVGNLTRHAYHISSYQTLMVQVVKH